MSGLPTGWRAAKLGDLGEWSSGGTPSRKVRANFGGKIPWVMTGDLRHQLIEEIGQTITEKGLADSAAKVFPCGTLLVAMYGATIGQTGVLAFDAATNQACAALLANGLTTEIIPYVWRYIILEQGNLKSIGQGGAQPNISQTILKEFAINVAPLAEQRRIVEKIDILSAKSRRARENLDHVPRLVEKYKQAVLTAAFRGALTRKWRSSYAISPDEAPAIRRRVQAERDGVRANAGLRSKGRNRSLPTKVVDLPGLPVGWSWLTFDDCAWDLTVGHVGPMKDRYVSKGIPFLRSLNVRANQIDLTNVVYIDDQFNRELSKSQLKSGDLLIVRTGEPGVAAVVPMDLKLANCSDLVICRLVQSMNSSYSAFYMNSEFAKSTVRNFQVGVAQQHFNVGAMSEMPVPYTSFDEQNEIVRQIETAFGWIERLSTEAKDASKLIYHLDQAVLAKGFRGELVPQDPNDEPASVLLERVKAGRATGVSKKANRYGIS